jgi:hypothetical protein
MRGHSVCSGQDANPTLSFIGSVSQIPLHLPHLVYLEGLALWFDEQDIGMETVINLFAGETMIAGVLFFSPSIETVEDLCKLESHILLSNPLISQKEITMTHFILMDRPFKELNGPFMPQDVFK